jgi:hypothetical protein
MPAAAVAVAFEVADRLRPTARLELLGCNDCAAALSAVLASIGNKYNAYAMKEEIRKL